MHVFRAANRTFKGNSASMSLLIFHDNMSSDAYTIHFLQGDKLVVEKTVTWNMDEERLGVGCAQGRE